MRLSLLYPTEEDEIARPSRLITLHACILLLGLCTQSASAQDFSRENIEPVTLRGSLVTSAENYSVPGMNTQRPVNTARLYFAPTLSFYGVDMPFSVLMSTEQREFNQPFNQFGASPTWRWLTLHAGYRSLQFSDYTLNDAVILGGGGEVRTDWLRVRGMYGRFRRSVAEDTLARTLPVYKRMGWAASAAVGSESSFLEVNALQAWDDSSSLTREPGFTEIFPSENVVVGLNGKLAVEDGKILLDAEGAGSLFTRDLRQPLSKNAGDDAASVIGYETQVSTRFNYAMRFGATYNAPLWAVRLGYARVEPEYETMGAYYTQNDMEDVTIAPSFRLQNGTFRANGSIGFRHDNLLDDRLYTTSRVIGSVNLGWMPDPAYGVDASYSNYSMSNGSGALEVNDSTRLQNVSESFVLTPRYSFFAGNMQHFILLLLTRQVFTDKNVLTGAMSDNDALTAVFNYLGTLQSGLGFSSALQFTEVHTVFVTNIIRGITVGVNKSFLENALNTSLSYTLNLTRASSESATDTQNLVTMSARYRLTTADVFELRFQFNNYHAVDPSRRSYSGTMTRVQYSRSFGF